jgi:hypothetical protein
MSDRPEWWDYVARTGPEGQRWKAAYRSPPYLPMSDATDRALLILQRHDLETGRRILDQVGEGLAQVADPAFRHVIGRFYYGVSAYHRYLIGDLSEAKRLLEQTHEEVRLALPGRPYLWPLAHTATDLCTQQARVARREFDWQTVEQLLENIWRIYTGEVPFYHLPDGTGVWAADLVRLYTSLDLTEEYMREDAVRYLFDREHCLRAFWDLVAAVYTLPDLVIGYP